MGARDELSSRVAALRESPAYSNYERARDEVLRMLDTSVDAAEGTPSAYWEHELRNFEYMLDASPLVVESLRHHTFHLTGIRTYEYRPNRDADRRRLEAKLRMLAELESDALLVPESPALGGFGHEIDGALYNTDTLKYFEVLIALERGAVLDEIRSPGRKLVWEIGAGWGGFAYQFKTLFPDITYVIVDLPELFLFSATYLMTLFPDASVKFLTGEEDWDDWDAADFVFVPASVSEAVRGMRPTLMLNMVSFQEMTTEQVTAYVERAHALGCRFLYSLNREKSGYNPEIESVSRIIDRYYWPREVSLLPVSYQKMLDEEASPNDYKHVIGWRRIVTT